MPQIQQAWTHTGLKDRRLKQYRLSSRMRKAILSQPMLLAARSALLYGAAIVWCPGRTARSRDPSGDLGVAADTCRPRRPARGHRRPGTAQRPRFHTVIVRRLGVLRRSVRVIVVLALALAACSPTPEIASPPSRFPDLGAFTAVDPGDYDDLGATKFLSPNEQVNCLLDRGPHESVICLGFPGVPDSVAGTGCATVRKADESDGDGPYAITRSGSGCVTARSVRPMNAGRKLVGKNATCVAGEDQLVACIDADNRHGFVLRPSGSWTF